MSKPTEKKKAIFLKALENAFGNKSVACQKCNIGRRTVYDWIEQDDEFEKACKDIDETVVDFAETKLQTLISEANVTAIIFFLKTKGKHRGYTESSDVNLNIPGKINVNVLGSNELPITNEDELPEHE